MNSTKKIESMARELMASGAASSLDEAISEVIQRNPKLYQESLEEKYEPDLPREVKAALATLTPSELADIQAKATEIYLRNRSVTEADSLMLAIQNTPGVHAKCADASPVRRDTLEKIRAMRETADKSGLPAYHKLKDIADGYRRGGMESDEAWVSACEDNPKLFQEWQDSQPSPTNTQHSPKEKEATFGPAKPYSRVFASQPNQGSRLEDRAAALVMAGQAASIDDAVDMVIAADPAAYAEYIKTMG